MGELSIDEDELYALLAEPENEQDDYEESYVPSDESSSKTECTKLNH